MQLTHFQPSEDHPLVLTDLPIPYPDRGQVLLKVHVCGVCHTDLHIVEGEIRPPHLPVTPGHQVVAEVVEPGPDVEMYKVGDRVGVPWLFSTDRECEYCRRGEENLCPQAKFTGFHVNGGYAEYMVAEANFVLPIPASISDQQAAPLLCAGIIGYRSLHKSDLHPGEHLGLVGFGASAHLALQVAKYWGCRVSVFTRAEEHRRHAMELGADWAGEAQDQPPQPLDRAIIFAPNGNLVPVTLEKIRPGGTLAINAVYMTDLPAMPYRLIYGERTLRSVANATFQDGLEFLQLAAEIPIHATVTMYPLDEANQALIALKHNRLNGEAVLDISSKG